jgi:triphosphoribosyl-dephospho-CoA synthase
MSSLSRHRDEAIDHAKACFLRACELDVAVRKPGNVSHASPGHGMRAQMFIDSAYAAAGPLFEPGAGVGARVRAAVDASFDVAGCNTNLGILLLCAPLALAVERAPDATSPNTLRRAIEQVLADLSLPDSEAAFLAIARAHPGGLGEAKEEDVNDAPTMDLRGAMALAADRDSIARQYRDGYADLFDIGLPTLNERGAIDAGFSLMAIGESHEPTAATNASVQRLYLTLLSRFPDSHIVRIHGEAVAHSVMTAAQAWLARMSGGESLDGRADFSEWDATLKAQRINPGTTADLTVAALMLAGLTQSG